jgi:hypothetical protein
MTDTVTLYRPVGPAFDVQNAGGVAHQEYWIPSESLPAFNAAIIGKIEVIAEFFRAEPS